VSRGSSRLGAIATTINFSFIKDFAISLIETLDITIARTINIKILRKI